MIIFLTQIVQIDTLNIKICWLFMNTWFILKLYKSMWDTEKNYEIIFIDTNFVEMFLKLVHIHEK